MLFRNGSVHGSNIMCNRANTEIFANPPFFGHRVQLQVKEHASITSGTFPREGEAKEIILGRRAEKTGGEGGGG